MSRGLGKVEKKILETIGRHRLCISNLIPFMYPPSPMGATFGARPTDCDNYSSIKRAVRSLERKGLIRRWSGSKWCLIERTDVKRTPPTGTLKKD